MSEETESDRQGKPLPLSTPTSEPFWAALRDERVEIQHCGRCEKYVFYPRSHCPTCLGDDLTWRTVSGRGRIHSFTVAREPTAPVFADETPLVLAIIELDEGPRLTSTVIGRPDSALAVGVAVEPVFDHLSEGVTLLRYRVTGG